MSHEIIYNRKFIKVVKDGKDCFIPLILSGSNNCQENYIDSLGRDRYKRVRDWGPIKRGSNPFEFILNKESLEEYIESFKDEEEYLSIKNNGKFMTPKQFRKFLSNGIKEAKTIEDINEEYFRKVELKAIITVYKGAFKTDVVFTIVMNTSKQILEAEEDIKKEYLSLLESGLKKTDISIYISYSWEDFYKYPKEKKARKKREISGDHFVLFDENRNIYPRQVTSRNLRYTYSKGNAKKFKTEKEAKKWAEKIQARFWKVNLKPIFVKETA